MGARFGVGLASAAAAYSCRSTSGDELAAPTGDELAAPTGAALGTVRGSVQGDTYNVLDYESPQEAVDAAAAAGGIVLFPPGTHTVRTLLLHHAGGPVAFVGDGATLVGSNDNEAVLQIMEVEGVTIQGLTIRHEHTSRRITNADGIRLLDVTGFSIEDVTVEDAAGAGILVSNGVEGSIVNCYAKSWADGIHLADGSENIIVQGCRTEETGDDGIAIVGYRLNHPPCRNIRILDNSVYHSSARGISVLGAEHVIVAGNQILETSVAGILVGYDSHWQTYGVEDVLVENNTITDANTWEDPGVDQAGIDVRSSSVEFPARDVRIVGNTINRGGWRMLNIGESGQELGVIDVLIEGNHLVGPNRQGTGIHAILAHELMIVRNTVTAARQDGIYIAEDCAGPIQVVDNALLRCNQGTSPFFRVLASDALVSGNTATP